MKTTIHTNNVSRYLAIFLAGEGEEKTFTQAQVDSMNAETRRKTEEKYAEQVKTLQREKAEALQKIAQSNGVSPEEKKRLEDEIEALKGQFQTVQERQKADKEKLLEDHKKTVSTLEAEKKAWQDRFTEQRIDAELSNVASLKELQVKSPAILRQILKPQTVLRPKTNDAGEQTGEFEAVVTVQVMKDGKLVPFTGDPLSAVQKMREDAIQYGPLFDSSQKGGTGANREASKTSAVIDVSDPAAYRKARAEGRIK